MPQLGPAEILVVAIIALLVFGPKRLPEVGRQVGHGLRELRKIQETVRAEIHDVMNQPDATPSLPTGLSSDAVDTPTSSPAPSSVTPPAPSRSHAPSRFRAPRA